MVGHNHFVCHFILGTFTEYPVLNSTDREQVLPSSHYQALTKETKEGKVVSTGKKIDFTQNLVLSARQSLVIEF